MADFTSSAFLGWQSGHAQAFGRVKTFVDGLTLDTAKPLDEEDWEEAEKSVWELAEVHAGFRPFFTTLRNVIEDYATHPSIAQDTSKIRVRALFRKLMPNRSKGRSTSPDAINNYKGTCGEIVDAFNTLRTRPSTKRVSVPTAYKSYSLDSAKATEIYMQNVAKYLPTKKMQLDLLKQDIDRTEVIVYNGGLEVKLYIEVKYDATTAVNKHGNVKEPGQLARIIAVVKDRKDLIDKYSDRVPAVSICIPDGWLELFTTRTARIYVTMGVWLLIDEMIFQPSHLHEISKYVWDKASNGQPYPDAMDTAKWGLMSSYFDKNKASFPRPSSGVFRSLTL